MRFWKWFSAQGGSGQYPPERNPTSLPYHQGEKIIKKEDTISEPVHSIVKSLKNCEWEYKVLTECMGIGLKFMHEGHKKSILVCQGSYGRAWCLEDWMTDAEQKMVGQVCLEIFMSNYAKEKQQRLVKERESFMCFVKEK